MDSVGFNGHTEKKCQIKKAAEEKAAKDKADEKSWKGKGSAF
jgi:hypothetical protein